MSHYKRVFKNNNDMIEYYPNGFDSDVKILFDRSSADYSIFQEWLDEGNTPEQPEPKDAMEEFRMQRNARLQATDVPWGIADYQHPNKQAWLDYRQALRDITETHIPELDENDILINIPWPMQPE